MSVEHQALGAEGTLAALPVRAQQPARRLGVVEVDRSWRIDGFEGRPSEPDYALGSTGIYLFNSSLRRVK